VKKREFKDKVYEELARITRALANPHRLEIVELLAQGPHSVEEISIQASLTVANTSQHLQVLKTAGLVAVARDGNFVFYRLADVNVFKAWKALRDLGLERMATVEKIVNEFRHSNFKHESLTVKELLKKLKTGKVTLIDVRPEHEYQAGHIAGAVSMPMEQLTKRMKELPRSKEIIAYCRGPFCVFADEAVAQLNKAGFKAKRLEEGFPDWQVAGYPVEMN
jgi:rhodanese-related sulfurtransferase